MKKFIIASFGQSLFDLAIMCYGSSEKVFQLLSENPGLSGIDESNLVGKKIFYTPESNNITTLLQMTGKRIGTYFGQQQDILLLEDGSALLLEDGTNILLE